MRSLSKELSNVCRMVRARAWWGHPQLFERWQQLTALRYSSGRGILPKRSG
jgi:hypothetical protein